VTAPAEALLVAAQLGRPPRTPWRPAARCSFGYPTVIVSPSRLDDGSPFPTFAWLTCPFLAEKVASAESDGAAAVFAARAASEPALAAALRALDVRVRELRVRESGGDDACESVGIGGQRNPLGVKCLHVHVALALLGEEDPIGRELLASGERECDDERCARLVGTGTSEEDQ